VNAPPVLSAVHDQTNHAGVPFLYSVPATDPDLPGNQLTFTLLTKPSGMTISADGVIDWPTTNTQAGTITPVVVTVSDDGNPSLSATQGFNIFLVGPPVMGPVLFVHVPTNDLSLPPRDFFELYSRLSWSAIPGRRYGVNYGATVALTNVLKFGNGFMPPLTYVFATNTNAIVLGPLLGTCPDLPTNRPSGNQFYQVRALP
jgi:hypothetical protein